MKIIEKFICGKENNLLKCEDELIITDHYVVIIDGVTAKSNYLWNGKKSGYYAKELLKGYFNEGIEKQNAEELFTHLDLLLKKNIDKNPNLMIEDYPRASIIIYNDIYKEIWSYGDCQCRINNSIYTHTKKIDEINADIRAFYLEYFLLQGYDISDLKKNDLGRAKIQEILTKQFAFENKDIYFGYPVLNGMGINKKMIKKYPIKQGDSIVLASDGYPVLKDSLQKCEMELKKIIENDPLCFRLYRSTKGIMNNNISFDDRTFCKILV